MISDGLRQRAYDAAHRVRCERSDGRALVTADVVTAAVVAAIEVVAAEADERNVAPVCEIPEDVEGWGLGSAMSFLYGDGVIWRMPSQAQAFEMGARLALKNPDRSYMILIPQAQVSAARPRQVRQITIGGSQPPGAPA